MVQCIFPFVSARTRRNPRVWICHEKKCVFFEKKAKKRLTVCPCSDYNPLTERRDGKHRPKHSVIQTETPLANAEAVFARSEKRKQFDRTISSPAKVGNQLFENWIWRKRNVDGEGLAEPILWFTMTLTVVRFFCDTPLWTSVHNDTDFVCILCVLVKCTTSQVKFSTWEFDPGSERTLAAGLTHASRTHLRVSGRRVSNAWETTYQYGTTVRNDC